MPRNRMTPEHALGVELSAILSRGRLAGSPAAVVDDLRRAAGDRVDVLAEEAGTWIGYYGDTPGRRELADALRTIEGVGPWIEVGRRRRSSGTHGAPRPGIDVPPTAG